MKYIVEADEHVQMISLIAVREGTAIMITGNVETFQTADKALEEAYQKGLEEGKKQAKVQAHLDVCHDIERVAHGNYQQGLNDAWEAARKIAQQWEEDTTEYRVVMDDSIRITLDSMTASEAIAKIKAYEQQKQEIQVGDEVEAFSGRAIVFGTFTDKKGNKFCRYWYPSDDSFNKNKTENLKRTGRHFPQVAELIKAMKEGAE